MVSYKFRLYPSKEVEVKMLETLDLCRQGYNILLGELNEQKEIDKVQIQGVIPDVKICEPKFKKVYSKTLQYECYRLFSNLSGLAKTKDRRKVGRLRFKSKNRFKTFTYNQSGFKLMITGKRCQTLRLSKIGDVPIRCHRDIKGEIKQITIKHYSSGKWYASISTELKISIPKCKIRNVVGIDLGLKDVIFDSNGNKVENPHHLKKRADKLSKFQRKLSKKKKGSSTETNEQQSETSETTDEGSDTGSNTPTGAAVTEPSGFGAHPWLAGLLITAIIGGLGIFVYAKFRKQ